MLLAVLLEVTHANVALLQPLVREEPVDVRLVDPDNRQSVCRLRMLAVRTGAVRLRLLAMEERDRSIGCRLGLIGHELVDGARLPAGEDVLSALDARVLA